MSTIKTRSRGRGMRRRSAVRSGERAHRNESRRSTSLRSRFVRWSEGRRELSRTFWLTACVAGALVLAGTIMIISASAVSSVREDGTAWGFAERQVIMTGVGLFSMVVVMFIPMRRWWAASPVLFGLSLIPLAMVVVPGLGANRNGASRWLPVGPFQFQPSEFVKVTLVLVVARLLTVKTKRVDAGAEIVRSVLPYLIVVVGLIMLQPNLGTSLVIVLTVLAMIFVAGVGSGVLSRVAVLGALATAFAVALTPFRLDRFSAFMDLRGNLDGSGYQTGQGMVGLANGGVFGRGLGQSTIKWGYLPYPYNDYIFAVIGEEFGLVGCLAVVGTFIALVCLGTSIARSAVDRFSMMVAAGLTAWLGGQAFLNFAVVTNVVPSTGVPLPFISAGGSAQVANLMAVGLLLNIARATSRSNGAATSDPVDLTGEGSGSPRLEVVGP